MDALRVPDSQPSSETPFVRVGFSLGIIFGLLVAIFYVWSRKGDRRLPQAHEALLLFRMLGAALLLCWCWCFDMYIWQRSRINYIYILEMDPRKHFRYYHMAE